MPIKEDGQFVGYEKLLSMSKLKDGARGRHGRHVEDLDPPSQGLSAVAYRQFDGACMKCRSRPLCEM